jgi:molecular chaperone GrpE
MTLASNEDPNHEADSLAEERAADHNNLPAEEQLVILREEVEEYRRETSQSLDAAQRAQADLVNYRRRADEERIALGKYSNTRLISKLLPVAEELDLAVTHAGGGTANDSWLEGIKLIQRKLSNLLESEGVTKIETVGAAFDPMEHEALGTVATNQHPPGHVAEAVRSGFRLHDRVIQPAQVIVAREPDETDQVNESSESKEIEHG